jgi:hypothetical protein
MPIDAHHNRKERLILVHSNIPKGGSVKSYDNNGKLVGEINHFRTADGKSVTTNTQYNTYNGHPTSQTVSVADPNGKVSTTTTINGKLLP